MAVAAAVWQTNIFNPMGYGGVSKWVFYLWWDFHERQWSIIMAPLAIVLFCIVCLNNIKYRTHSPAPQWRRLIEIDCGWVGVCLVGYFHPFLPYPTKCLKLMCNKQHIKSIIWTSTSHTQSMRNGVCPLPCWTFSSSLDCIVNTVVCNLAINWGSLPQQQHNTRLLVIVQHASAECFGLV